MTPATLLGRPVVVTDRLPPLQTEWITLTPWPLLASIAVVIDDTLPPPGWRWLEEGRRVAMTHIALEQLQKEMARRNEPSLP